MIFNNPHFKNNKKTQSENLQLIKNEPFDETDIGLSVSNSNTGLKVVQVLQNNSCDDDFKYVIRIPEHMDIKYKHSSWDGEDLLIENVLRRIENQ